MVSTFYLGLEEVELMVDVVEVVLGFTLFSGFRAPARAIIAGLRGFGFRVYVRLYVGIGEVGSLVGSLEEGGERKVVGGVGDG